MHRFLPSLLVLSATVLAPSLLAQGNRVPNAEEREKAQPEVVRVLAERILQSRGGDITLASSEVLAAAFDTQDRATRYLLWRQSIDIAAKAGNAWIALQHDRTFAKDFGLDPHRTGIALLKRMAKSTKDVKQIANVSFAAMYTAGDHALDEDDTIMLSYYDVAVRTSMRTNHAPLYSHVRDYLASLRAPRAIGKVLENSLHDSPWPAATVASGLVQGEIRMFEPFEMRDFKAVFSSYGDVKGDRRTNTLTADELIELSKHATHPLLKTGMLRCAQQRLLRGYIGANEKTRQESCRKITKLAEQLCTNDGVARLRFQDHKKLSQLAYANGEWSTDKGRLIGKAKGANNFATHRINFSLANVVIIYGGIQSESCLNFRCKVGDVNLLLNWEVQPQNHLWINGACHRTEPPVLTQGEEHTIAIFSDGANAHVCVDNKHMWTVNSCLTGTISVYPALDSEIFVREILIDGNPAGLVDMPIGVMM
ncbi:MAG: hypothetical protein ACI89X_004138 [Planctomycetota bacterium]|jgi:hypothetical protein